MFPCMSRAATFSETSAERDHSDGNAQRACSPNRRTRSQSMPSPDTLMHFHGALTLFAGLLCGAPMGSAIVLGGS